MISRCAAHAGRSRNFMLWLTDRIGFWELCFPISIDRLVLVALLLTILTFTSLERIIITYSIKIVNHISTLFTFPLPTSHMPQTIVFLTHSIEIVFYHINVCSSTKVVYRWFSYLLIIIIVVVVGILFVDSCLSEIVWFVVDVRCFLLWRLVGLGSF